MKGVYQFIRLFKLQILSSLSNHASVRTPGFPVYLALILLLIVSFLGALQYEAITITRSTMTTSSSFESTSDNFRLQIPKGWMVWNVNNTGPVLSEESRQGYGILAQLCPAAEGEKEGQQQEQGAIINVSGDSSSRGSCQQQSQGEIIHIIRYPNLGARLGIAVTDIRDTIPDSIFEYEIQKLQEVGYRDINILDSTKTKLLAQYRPESAVPIVATVPAKLVEMTYRPDSAPSEIKRGYLILTATNATPPNLETITGYGIFYEAASGVPSEEVRQIVNSFELIPSEEAQAMLLDLYLKQISRNQADQESEEGEK
jgi:hypothetical protein